MKANILLVDDEIDNVEALERLFRRKYNVLKATSGPEALEILNSNTVSAIISDQRMPQMTGVEFLKLSIQTQPDAIRILLTGYTDIESVISAINAGEVYKYVTKPWDPIDLHNTIDKGVEKFNLKSELKQKNKELKVLDEAKTNFMLLINHELKTPLTSISSYLQLLQETELDSTQKKSVKRIFEAYERLETLVNNTLTLIKAETGQWNLELNDYEIQSLLYTKDVILNLDVDSINCDKQSFEIIFSELLGNALKFKDEGTDVILTSKTLVNGVEISITNTGKIIDPKKITTLLQPFTLDEEALNHSKGTGLGLSICQALLKLHRSELKISATGKITTVSFVLNS